MFSVNPANSLQCPNGGDVILMALDSNLNGVLDSGDADIRSATVCNGLDGEQGQTGATGAAGASGLTPFTTVSIIQPCGFQSSPYKEALLCLGDGNILSSFSDTAGGLNTRFSFLETGTFYDTDDSSCLFTAQSLSNGLAISWGAGSNQYSNWAAGVSDCIDLFPTN